MTCLNLGADCGGWRGEGVDSACLHSAHKGGVVRWHRGRCHTCYLLSLLTTSCCLTNLLSRDWRCEDSLQLLPYRPDHLQHIVEWNTTHHPSLHLLPCIIRTLRISSSAFFMSLMHACRCLSRAAASSRSFLHSCASRSSSDITLRISRRSSSSKLAKPAVEVGEQCYKQDVSDVIYLIQGGRNPVISATSKA